MGPNMGLDIKEILDKQNQYESFSNYSVWLVACVCSGVGRAHISWVGGRFSQRWPCYRGLIRPSYTRKKTDPYQHSG